MTEPTPARNWSGRARGHVLGYWFFHQGLKWLGRDLAGWLLYPVIAYYWLFARAARRFSHQYLSRLPGLAKTGTFAHLLSFGQVLLDRACFLSGTGGKFSFSFEGEDLIRQALAQGRGLILVSAHMGNWEAAGNLLRERISTRMHVAMVSSEANRVNAYLQKTQDTGFKIIPIENQDSGLMVLSALRQGELVAMQGDRFLPGARTRKANFLGSPASFPEGPFQLAALAGAPIIVCFALRIGPRRYQFKAYPPEWLAQDPKNRSQMVAKAVDRYAALVEETVRQYPLQWFNFYDFWAKN